MKMSGQLQALAALQPRKNPGTHWIADWVGSNTGPNGLTLPGLEPRTVQPIAYSLHSTTSCADFRNMAPLKEIYAIFHFVYSTIHEYQWTEIWISKRSAIGIFYNTSYLKYV